MMERNLRVFIVLALVMVFVYFTQNRNVEPVLVEISAETQLEGDDLTLSGQANLPDGAILLYTLSSQSSQDEVLSGRTTVRNGRFSEDVNISSLPDGEIEGRLIFEVVLPAPPQPPEVIERYGALGQHMAGPLVVEREPVQRAELSFTVQRVE